MIDLQPACDQMIELLGRVADEQLAGPTPCAEYTVGDLVDHVDLVCRGATALAREDAEALAATADGPEAVSRNAGWQNVVAGHVRAVGEAWDDAAVWARPDGMPGSGLSNETWGKITLTELVVHGWDLARATGHGFDLPEPMLQACLDHVADFVPNAPVPALWGPAVPVGPDATLLDRIVAITGRTP